PPTIAVTGGSFGKNRNQGLGPRLLLYASFAGHLHRSAKSRGAPRLPRECARPCSELCASDHTRTAPLTEGFWSLPARKLALRGFPHSNLARERVRLCEVHS